MPPRSPIPADRTDRTGPRRPGVVEPGSGQAPHGGVGPEVDRPQPPVVEKRGGDRDEGSRGGDRDRAGGADRGAAAGEGGFRDGGAGGEVAVARDPAFDAGGVGRVAR